MTEKEAKAIENAIQAAAASVVSGCLVLMQPRDIPEGWINDVIRKRIQEALQPAIDVIGQ